MLHSDSDHSRQPVTRAVHAGDTLLSVFRKSRSEKRAHGLEPAGVLLADWDLLLDAVEVKLSEIANPSSGLPGGQHGLENAGDETLLSVRDCLDALRHLHAMLPEGSARFMRLTQAIGHADAALARLLAKPLDGGPMAGARIL
ncbi:MAG: hypothetical protein ABIP46_00410 [Polaromonas sp.]